MDESPATRCSLIVKLRDPADSAAWREFVAIYEPLVYRLARRKGLQDADARDLCQEVFQAVARAIDRWEPGRGSFRGWLSRIARNLLINFLTRRQFQLADQGPPACRSCSRPSRPSIRRPRPSSRLEYERCLFRWAADEIRGEFTPDDLAGVLADRRGGSSARRGGRRARAVGRGRLRRQESGPGPAQAADRATGRTTTRGSGARSIMKTQSDPCDPDRLRLLAEDRLPPAGLARARGTSRAVRGVPRPSWTGWSSSDGDLTAVRKYLGADLTEADLSRLPTADDAARFPRRRPTGPTRWAGSGPTRSRACSGAAGWAWCSRHSTPR